MRNIYLVGSLRNPEIPKLATRLRDAGHRVFDDWFSAGEDADDIWRLYEIDRGRSYVQALDGAHAENVFEFDRKHIIASDTVILVLPAGRSGHLELGFAAGLGKSTHILLDAEYDRWDIMYRFAECIWNSVGAMVEHLGD